MKKMKYEDVPGAMAYFQGILDDIRDKVKLFEHKRASIYIDWLKAKLQYIFKEDTYDPKKDIYYKRGEIVHVDLGFNIGNEIGGKRFAIVCWSPQSSGTMTIIPITSEKAGSTHNRNIHVLLGELLEDGIVNWAKVEQVRAVSKLRVRPIPKKKYKTSKLSPAQLDEIDGAIMRLYTKQP
jgi:mRNA interferase MazF